MKGLSPPDARPQGRVLTAGLAPRGPSGGVTNNQPEGICRQPLTRASIPGSRKSARVNPQPGSAGGAKLCTDEPPVRTDEPKLRTGEPEAGISGSDMMIAEPSTGISGSDMKIAEPSTGISGPSIVPSRVRSPAFWVELPLKNKAALPCGQSFPVKLPLELSWAANIRERERERKHGPCHVRRSCWEIDGCGLAGVHWLLCCQGLEEMSRGLPEKM
jgi:hypothetical protein